MADGKVYVKKDYLNTLWEADFFFETDDGLCYAAVQRYRNTDGNDIDIVFMNDCAFIIYDGEEEVILQKDDILQYCAKSYQDGIDFFDEYSENFMYCADGGEIVRTDEEWFNLSEDQYADVLERLADLAGNWAS